MCYFVVGLLVIKTTWALKLTDYKDSVIKYPYVNTLAATLKFQQEEGANCTGDVWQRSCNLNANSCVLKVIGEGWGGHQMCGNLIQKNACQFFSYGIANDYSFDADLEKNFGCNGVGLDPTVEYPKLLPGTNISFRHEAAPMLQATLPDGWKATSVTSLRREMQLAKVDILKMDCEGCEYALATDVLNDDPDFFHHVGQFVVEVHHDKRFMKTLNHLAEYERLLGLLSDANLELQQVTFTGCGENKNGGDPEKIHHACLPELEAAGYHCAVNCVNMIFART